MIDCEQRALTCIGPCGLWSFGAKKWTEKSNSMIHSLTAIIGMELVFSPDRMHIDEISPPFNIWIVVPTHMSKALITCPLTCAIQEVEDIRETPQEGVYVYGLYLEGCGWCTKTNRLVESQPKKMFHPLPVLYVTAVQARSIILDWDVKVSASGTLLHDHAYQQLY